MLEQKLVNKKKKIKHKKWYNQWVTSIKLHTSFCITSAKFKGQIIQIQIKNGEVSLILAPFWQ